MSLTPFPNGVSSFGVPVMGGASLPTTTGSYFFVDSGAANATDSGPGTSPALPLATIDAAIGKCTANNGDVIVVMPGHAETISGATGIVVDVDGVAIIGLGIGRSRPVISFDNTASRIPVSADNVFIANLVFLGAVADIVSGVTVTGDDVTLQNCDFEVGSAILEFLQMLDIDAATRASVRGCRFIASATAGTNTGVRLDATADSELVDCLFLGDFTTAAISGTAGTAAASTRFLLARNYIENVDVTAGQLLDHHDDTTGLTVENRGFSGYTTDITASFDTGATRCVENLVNNLIDETGGPSPAVASA